MAKLLANKYPIPQLKDAKNINEHYKEIDRILDEIPKDRLISSSVADGYAYYYIVSFKPLVLQHIPAYDGYMMSPAEIRGMRLQDIKMYQSIF